MWRIVYIKSTFCLFYSSISSLHTSYFDQKKKKNTAPPTLTIIAEKSFFNMPESKNDTKSGVLEVETSNGPLPYNESSSSEQSGSKWKHFKDSFKRADNLANTEGLTAEERVTKKTAESPLAKSLKGRHMQMIAIGGSIGTGLFVGSGKILATGGPASCILAYAFLGTMLYCTVQALGELAVTFPVSGAFAVYNSQFISRPWGFAMGWNYAIFWLVVLPIELVASSIVIGYWNDKINGAVWVAVFFVFIFAINLFGVKGYGEAEFWFSCLKVLAICGFIILGIVLACGGGPTHEYIGGKYWKNPGAFHHGFKGLCSVFVTGAFSFGGTEFVGLTAAEATNPRKSVPKASKQVFWRIALFYIISLLLVGLLVPYTDKKLVGGSSSYDAKASPFVIAIQRGGIKGLPSVINAVILVSVLSVGNSSIFGCSRTIVSMAEQGFAPQWLGYIDRKGRPLGAMAVTAAFGLLGFLSASKDYGKAFNWFMAISGLSTIFTWGSICACHILFRRAMKLQGRSTDELPFLSQTGIAGSYYGLIFNCLVLVAQFWIAAWPIGGKGNAADFFSAYLTVPVVIVSYLGYMFYKRDFNFFVDLKKVDLDSGRKVVDLDLLKQEIREEKEYIRSKPWWFRVYNVWC